MRSDAATQLARMARDHHEDTFTGVKRLRYVDFPDHPNIGDSAIALGQLAFLRESGRDVLSTHCIGTFDRRLLRSLEPVLIHGGGNIAGFFRGIDDHRNRLGADLRVETLLIQGPQSVHFVTPAARSLFEVKFLSRQNLRIAVRDREAQELLQSMGASPHLTPDAAHLLGPLAAPAPTRSHVILRRQDQESATPALELADHSVDWPRDPNLTRAASWIRWKVRYGGAPAQLFNPSVRRWNRIAQRRLDRGVRILAPGRIVVTDRLHAMIIGLHMGRTVFAIDNANRKLSKYADTWFEPGYPVHFFDSFSDAIASVPVSRLG